MALVETDLFETRNKVNMAIERLQHYEPPEGYYLAFSGGKDSICIKELANMAGVKYAAHYNFTGIDPPPLVKFIRKYHSDVIIERPAKSFFKLMLHKRNFPSRQIRWCCDLLKEVYGTGYVITGVRWAESRNRSKRKMIHPCTKSKFKIFINPILDWTNDDVWDFIREKNLPYPELYDKGWKRIGCLMCPMASSRYRKRDAAEFPEYARAYRRIFKRIWKIREKEGKPFKHWKNSDEMFNWWLDDGHKSKDDKNQQCFIFDN